jgi:hypothetical protein
MTEVTSITVAQLRAAYLAWESDVRANRSAFASDEEERSRPLDEQVDGLVDILLGYVEKTRQLESTPA